MYFHGLSLNQAGRQAHFPCAKKISECFSDPLIDCLIASIKLDPIIWKWPMSHWVGRYVCTRTVGTYGQEERDTYPLQLLNDQSPNSHLLPPHFGHWIHGLFKFERMPEMEHMHCEGMLSVSLAYLKNPLRFLFQLVVGCIPGFPCRASQYQTENSIRQLAWSCQGYLM